MLSKSKNRASIHSISEKSTKTHHTVLLHFIPRYYCHKILDSIILFDILSMKSGTKTDTVEWNIPKNVQLVDETFNHGSIDLLIDADLLYEIQCSGYLFLLKTLIYKKSQQLGWVVSCCVNCINK